MVMLVDQAFVEVVAIIPSPRLTCAQHLLYKGQAVISPDMDKCMYSRGPKDIGCH